MATERLKLRVVFGLLEGEDVPVIAGCIDPMIWEVIPPEDWEAQVLEMKRACMADWAVYDWREVVIEVPRGDVMALFQTGSIEGEVSRG